MIKRYLERLFARVAPALEGPELDWPAAKSELIETVSSRLAPIGLEHQSAMQWTERKSSPDGIRRLFRVHDAGAMRALTVNWGYSLDFVPHVSGTEVVWHRTFASARRDLWFIPADPDLPKAPRSLGKAHFDATYPNMISDGVERACAFWDQGHGLADLTSLLETAEYQTHKLNRTASGHIMARSALSLPFAYARTGHADAKHCLEETLSALALPDQTADAVRRRSRER